MVVSERVCLSQKRCVQIWESLSFVHRRVLEKMVGMKAQKLERKLWRVIVNTRRRQFVVPVSCGRSASRSVHRNLIAFYPRISINDKRGATPAIVTKARIMWEERVETMFCGLESSRVTSQWVTSMSAMSYEYCMRERTH